MQITVNLTDPRANSIALDEVIFSQAETTLTFNVSPSTESLADGLSVALLTPQGETLALALVSASAAVLSTSTVECYEFVKGLPIEAARSAYLVIGESLSPKAIIPVQVARNPIAEIAPPTESAPIYPTSQELQSAIDRIETALTKIEEVEDIVEGFDETVQAGIAELNAAKEAGVTAVFNAQSQAVGTLQLVTDTASGLIDEAKTSAVQAVETSKSAAETALQGKVDEATQSIAQSTETSTNAAADAAKAKEEAEEAEAGAEAAKEAAETALNNGCVYKVVDLAGDASVISLARETTIYKVTPTQNLGFYFSPPTLAADEVIVFWLWVVMGETAHQLTFPSAVTWITEGSFAANTETMLAFMSVDGGATWQANVQWEKAVTA